VLSINIIDGVSGIAGSAVFIMFFGLVFLAGQPGDAMVVHLPLAGIGATLGFLVLNCAISHLFSIYRRKIVRKTGVSKPDRLLLHALFFSAWPFTCINRTRTWHRYAMQQSPASLQPGFR
jgi:hypothetical protein